MTLTYALFQTIVRALVALGWGRLTPAIRDNREGIGL